MADPTLTDNFVYPFSVPEPVYTYPYAEGIPYVQAPETPAQRIQRAQREGNVAQVMAELQAERQARTGVAPIAARDDYGRSVIPPELTDEESAANDVQRLFSRRPVRIEPTWAQDDGSQERFMAMARAPRARVTHTAEAAQRALRRQETPRVAIVPPADPDDDVPAVVVRHNARQRGPDAAELDRLSAEHQAQTTAMARTAVHELNAVAVARGELPLTRMAVGSPELTRALVAILATPDPEQKLAAMRLLVDGMSPGDLAGYEPLTVPGAMRPGEYLNNGGIDSGQMLLMPIIYGAQLSADDYIRLGVLYAEALKAQFDQTTELKARAKIYAAISMQLAQFEWYERSPRTMPYWEMGQTLGTVRNQLTRLRDRLKPELENAIYVAELRPIPFATSDAIVERLSLGYGELAPSETLDGVDIPQYGVTHEYTYSQVLEFDDVGHIRMPPTGPLSRGLFNTTSRNLLVNMSHVHTTRHRSLGRAIRVDVTWDGYGTVDLAQMQIKTCRELNRLLVRLLSRFIRPGLSGQTPEHTYMELAINTLPAVTEYLCAPNWSYVNVILEHFNAFVATLENAEYLRRTLSVSGTADGIIRAFQTMRTFIRENGRERAEIQQAYREYRLYSQWRTLNAN